MAETIFLATGGWVAFGGGEGLINAGVPADGIVSVAADGDGFESLTEGDLFGTGEVLDLAGNGFDATDAAAEFGPDAFIAPEAPVSKAPAPRALAVGPSDDVVIPGMGGLGFSRGAAAAALDDLEALVDAGEIPDLAEGVPESFSLAEARALLPGALPGADIEALLAPYAQAGRVPTTVLTGALERRLQQLDTASLARNLEAAAQAAWQERIANWLDGRSDNDAISELLTAARHDIEIRAWLYDAIADRLEAGTLDHAGAINRLAELKDVVTADIRADRRGPMEGPLEWAFARLEGVIDLVLHWDESLALEEEFEGWEFDDSDALGAPEDEAGLPELMEPTAAERREWAEQALATLRSVTPQETIRVGRFAQLAVRAGFNTAAAVEYLQANGPNGQISGAAIQTFLDTHQPRPVPDDDDSLA